MEKDLFHCIMNQILEKFKMNINEENVEKLRKKFDNVHPLIFERSFEYSKDVSELWDILSSIPEKMPIKWCFKSRKWITEHIEDIPRE